MDGAARSVVADFIQTFDGDPAAFDVTLDRVPSPIIGTLPAPFHVTVQPPRDCAPAVDAPEDMVGTRSKNDATNCRFSMIAEAYCASLDTAEKSMSVKDRKSIRGKLDRFIE